MIRWIVGSSVRLGRLVVAVAVAVVGFGIVQMRSAPVDDYPEFMPPMVQIQTEALGLSAAEVEQLITVPLEQDLLNGVPWLSEIRSESMTGLSSVDLVFEPGTDVLQARQMVQERLSQVAGLPNVGSRPVMIQPLSSESRVMMIGLSSKSLSLIDMSVLARWKIKPRLMGIPGVANVAIWGQRDRQLQVQVDPERLRARGVSLNQVLNSTGNALWSSPLTFVEASTPGTGGFIDTANQRFGVQHMMPIITPEQLGAVTIEGTSGRRLRLRNVAHVVEDHQPLIGDAMTEQGPSLILVVQKFPRADTLKVTRDVEDAMAALAPGLSGIRVDTRVYRAADFIEASLHNVGTAALLAMILMILVLGAFSLSWRVVVISFVAIPVSLIAAAYVLYLRGTTFNSITVAGLVAALGVVVDDAIVDLDHIRRRLGKGRAPGDSAPPVEQVVDASYAVRAPLVYATLILLAAVVPLAVQGGVSGSFSRQFAVSYALAVLASMVVALTLTPALTFMLMGRASLPRRTSPLVKLVRNAFDRRAPRYVQSPVAAYGAVAVLLLALLATIPQMGSRSLLPAPHDRDLLVQFEAAPGTSLREMDRIMATVSQEMSAVHGVRDVGVHLGRAITSDQVVDVDSGELWVNIAPSADYAATLREVQRVMDAYPGLDHHVLTYEKERLGAARVGTGRPLVVRVFGQDFDRLRATAEQVRRTIATVDGVAKPRVEAQTEEPDLQIEVDLAAAERAGIRPGDVRRTAATLVSGLLVGNLYERQKIFDVVVWGTPAVRRNLTSVQDLLIDTPAGGHVRLSDVASVRMAADPAVIRHEDVSRYVDVTADVHGRSLDAVDREVTSKVRALSFPLEYHAQVVGQTAAQAASDRMLLLVLLAVLVGIFLLLQAATRSWGVALLLLLTIPLAGVGGVAAASLAGGIMSAGALMGLLVVLAVTTRSSLLLVTGYQRRAAEAGAPGSTTVLQGTRDRVVAVVLTAATLAAAMIPLAVFADLAGEEILHPLAVVVLGGLVTSLFVTLFVLPVLYLRFVAAARGGQPVLPSSSSVGP